MIPIVLYMDRKSKQVIVMRKTFMINGEKRKLRTGKYASQCAHASMGALLNYMQREGYGGGVMILPLNNNMAVKNWLENAFTKICCAVETEEEIVELYNKAKEKGLLCSLIKDSGLTEFGGVPTITCCAIGPAWENEVNEITGDLQLF